MPAEPTVLAFLQLRPELLCSCCPGETKTRRFPASSVTRAGTDVAVARAKRRRTGPPSVRKGSLRPHLCSGCPCCRIPFFLLPFFKTPCQSSKPRLKVSLLAGCLLSPQARLIFPFDGLLQSCVHPLLLLFALHQNKSLLYLSCLLDSLLLENESFLPHPRREAQETHNRCPKDNCKTD